MSIQDTKKADPITESAFLIPKPRDTPLKRTGVNSINPFIIEEKQV